ncbi:MAG TPA: hypothetical protein VGF40_20475 [Thermoanaerobaculia bacterium]
MPVRTASLLILLFFAVSLSAGSGPVAPRDPFPENLEQERNDVRSIRAFNSVSVVDVPGDFRIFQLVTSGLQPSPAGTSFTLTIPKWFVAGSLSFPMHVSAGFFDLGGGPSDQLGSTTSTWDGSTMSFTHPQGEELPPFHITRYTIENGGPTWRLTAEFNQPLPPGSKEYTIQFQFYPIGSGKNGVAAAWNSGGKGMYHFFWQAGGPEAESLKKPWLDLVGGSARQVDGDHVEFEAVVNGPFPATAPAPINRADAFILFTDANGVRLTDVVQMSLTQAGWNATLATYDRTIPGGDQYAPREQLPAPVVDGSRVSVRVPLRGLSVRDRFKASILTRAFVATEFGEVVVTSIDSSPALDLSLADPPEVVVTALPDALVQLPDQGGATTAFTLTNVGDAPTTITLSRSGDFFSVEPAVFELAGGTARRVTLTGSPKGPGDYTGAVTASGLGVPQNLQVPVRMLVTAPPSSGEADARADENRVDVTAPADQGRVEAEVGFTNVGTAPLTGLVVPDVPWLEVPQSILTIPPGQRASIHFAINRGKRVDGSDPLGSTVGNLSLKYLSGSGSGAAARLVEALGGGIQVSTTLVTVTDTAKPKTTVGAPTALRSNEIALFVASLGHVQSPVGTFISDLYLASLSPLTNVSVYYTRAGQPLASTIGTTIDSISAARPIAFTDLTKTVFDQSNGLGTLQVRGTGLAALAVSASVFNKSNAAGTYGSAIPVLRSDRGIGAADAICIPGLVGSSSRGRTNLVIQELKGKDAPVAIELLDAAGATVATRDEFVPAFQHIRVNDAVPAGATSAVIRLRAGAEGSVLAYATPLDALSGDTWVVTDWPRVEGFDAAGRQIIPNAGKLEGANANYFRSSAALMNRGAAPANVIVRFVPRGAAAIEKTVSLQPRATAVYEDIVGELFGASGVGFLEIDPQGAPVTVTSRTFATIGNDPKTFGTGVPAVTPSSMKTGSAKRISGFDDADTEVVVAKTPATFRTNLGLVETAGKGATVRVTVHFRHPVSTTVTAVGSASKEFVLAPRQFLLLQGIAAEVLGEFRASLKGNLKDLFADFEVVSGEGEVIAFTSSVDNGTGDQLFKLQ